MDRRTFLRLAATVPAVSAFSNLSDVLPAVWAQQKEFDPRPGDWHSWEVTARLEIGKPAGVTRLWMPIPVVEGEYQKVQENRWSGNARIAERMEAGHGAAMVYAEFPESEKAPVLEVVSRFQTRDRRVDWSSKTAAALDAAEAKKYTQPTELMPTDGIVKETAEGIVRGKTSDLDKTRAIYDWVLANTYREPKIRGCGLGDIRGMLVTRNFGGKCADLNGLFVGLVRAAGIPARHIYGIRVGPSAFGYRSLGSSGTTVTKSQHCRGEVFLAGYGWVPMDPADVAKAAREETAEWLKIDHPLIAPVRDRLFGSWEGNWLGYNQGQDVELPRSAKGTKLAYLMYPQGETAEGRLDSFDPDAFKYTITSKPVTA
jgi:transglutaminase-like putative cysteine protease